jgi:hypothetical protein
MGCIQNFGDGVSCNIPRPPGGIGLKWFLKSEGKWIGSDIPSPDSHSARIAGLAQPILDFLAGKRPAIATAKEGRDVLRITLASYQSAEQGWRIRLDGQ